MFPSPQNSAWTGLRSLPVFGEGWGGVIFFGVPAAPPDLAALGHLPEAGEGKPLRTAAA